ncbi:MAG: GMP synthase [Pseudomonadota bacterium]
MSSSDWRLGILHADVVPAARAHLHGDYPQLFERLFAAQGLAADRIRHVPAMGSPLPSVTAADAWLVTGSQYSVYDPLPWIPVLAEFCDQVRARGRPLVGICFGHQLFAHFFGGEVALAEAGWQIGVQRYRLTATAPWIPTEATEFSLLASHQDQVVRLPADGQVLAANDACPIAAYQLGARTVGVQGHPEFTRPFAAHLMASRAAQIGAARLDAARASFQEATTEGQLAGWLCNFLGGGGSDRVGAQP